MKMHVKIHIYSETNDQIMSAKKRGVLDRATNMRHLANMTERFVLGGDAVCRHR